MSRLFYHVMQDNAGNLLFDVSGTMRLAGSGTLATIYGDEALTVILPNPMTNHPSFGSFKCFLGAGSYDFYMAKSGYTFETLTGVQGHGTMAQQNASAVAITGGSATGLSGFANATGDAYVYGLRVGAATGLAEQGQLEVHGPSHFEARLGVQTTTNTNAAINLRHTKGSQHGLVVQPSDVDVGPGNAMIFQNLASGVIGSITTNATATAYNTTSDARLKFDVAPLTGALDVVRRLRPVSFLWQADGSPGRGFLAHEVADVVDGVVTGEKDAINPDGTINPQQIDYSKLVPWLIGACKELAARVEALEALLPA